MKGIEFCLEMVIGVLSVRAAEDLDDLKRPEVTGLEMSLVSPLPSVSTINEGEDEVEAEADCTETREAEICCSLTADRVTVL